MLMAIPHGRSGRITISVGKMHNIILSNKPEEDLKILCLGAHCDDIEIGCGGTLLKLIERHKNIQVLWVVFASNEVRKKEAQLSAGLFLEDVKNKEVIIFEFQDGFLPSVWSDVKRKFEDFKRFSPDVIFTHYRDDLHQDHRTLNKLTWNTFRNHLILEYEIMKYDGDLGNPNIFVPLEEEYLKKKNEILFRCFKSQLDKQWFDEELLMSLPRIRAVQCASAQKYAESFYNRKMIL